MASSLIGQPLANKTFDVPKNSDAVNEKLMSPHAVEDQETVTGDNPQKAWIGGGGKPSAPFGPQGRSF